MIVLYGVEYYGRNKVSLALFSSDEKLRDYVRLSRLKNPRDSRFPFRKSSLLRSYTDYDTGEYEQLEIDPEVDL